MGLRTIVQSYQKRREIRNFQRQNVWEGLVPGDVVEYNGQRYMYRGINKNGGPGMPDFPEPVFGTDKPTVPDKVWYLRNASYPFGEIPDVMKESAQSAQAGNTGTNLAFLNASRSDLKKVGHITPDEWKVMVDKLRKELAGKK